MDNSHQGVAALLAAAEARDWPTFAALVVFPVGMTRLLRNLEMVGCLVGKELQWGHEPERVRGDV